MPRIYVVAFYITDPAVLAAVNALNERFHGDMDLVDVNQADWPGAEAGTNVYFVGHSSPFAFETYRSPSAMLSAFPQLKETVVAAGKVVLMSCSAGGLPVNDNGFAAKSFAENLAVLANRPVVAAAGPVDGATLEVEYTWDGHSVGSNDGWFQYDSVEPVEAGDPFAFKEQ